MRIQEVKIQLIQAAIISKEEQHMTKEKFEQFKKQHIDLNEQQYYEVVPGAADYLIAAVKYHR